MLRANGAALAARSRLTRRALCMCGNWIGPRSTIECLLSAGGGPAVSAGTRGSPWPAAYVGGTRDCPVPAWPRWSAASGVARLALGEADSWMILCLQDFSQDGSLHHDRARVSAP